MGRVMPFEKKRKKKENNEHACLLSGMTVALVGLLGDFPPYFLLCLSLPYSFARRPWFTLLSEYIIGQG